jgi:hypothetical protein
MWRKAPDEVLLHCASRLGYNRRCTSDKDLIRLSAKTQAFSPKSTFPIGEGKSWSSRQSLDQSEIRHHTQQKGAPKDGPFDFSVDLRVPYLTRQRLAVSRPYFSARET